MVQALASSTLPKAANDDCGAVYRESVALVERLHRQLLDVVSDDLDRAGRSDLTAIQALLIYHIGEGEFSAGELRARGLYQGSNVSYNLKKLVEAGMLRHEKSPTDKRMVKVSLTDTGIAVCQQLSALFSRHTASLGPVGGIKVESLETANTAFMRLERFWGDQVRFRL
jgi:DNA-binding MarR family transcriptional regulator